MFLCLFNENENFDAKMIVSIYIICQNNQNMIFYFII